MPAVWQGAYHTQEHGQEEQAVVQAEGDHEEEDLEKAGEDVRLGGGEENEGEEGGDTAVEDGWTDIGEGGADPLLTAAAFRQEAVHDVGRIVHTQAWEQKIKIAMLRFRDVYPGSEFFPSRTPDPQYWKI